MMKKVFWVLRASAIRAQRPDLFLKRDGLQIDPILLTSFCIDNRVIIAGEQKSICRSFAYG